MMITILFDTEVDGLVQNSARRLDKQPNIFELYALKVEEVNGFFSEIGEFNSFFEYKGELPKKVVEITGVKTEDLAGAPSFKSKADEIKTFFEGADRIVAHNLAFDIAVMEIAFKKNNKITPQWPLDRLCTVEATEHMKGYRLNLQALHEELLGEGFEGAHRAETDVRAMFRCYKELVKRDIV